MTTIEQRIKDYADARWPERDAIGTVRKLGEELVELAEAVAQNDETGIRIEAADMAILLTDLLAIKGDSLKAWVVIKTGILEGRLEAAKSTGLERINEELGG